VERCATLTPYTQQALQLLASVADTAAEDKRLLGLAARVSLLIHEIETQGD
jgi:hypothetical protein